MQQIRSPQDVTRLGTIMVVSAHPDDETFCAGGLMAAASANGQKVICITATKGEAGVQDNTEWSAQHLGTTRHQELMAALRVLGIHNHHWLSYRDGHCASADPQTAARQIARYISQHKPDTILTFGPEGMTGHPDHRAVSEWVTLAANQMPQKPDVYHAVITVSQYTNYLQAADQKLNMFYNIDQPPLVEDQDCDICFCCTDELCHCKQQAFEAMPSQFQKMLKTLGREYMSQAFRVEAFVRVTPEKLRNE